MMLEVSTRNVVCCFQHFFFHFFRKAVSFRRIQINLTDDLTIYKDWHTEFRTAGSVTGYVTGEGKYIVDPLRFFCCAASAADPFIKWDMHACYLSLEWTKD